MHTKITQIQSVKISLARLGRELSLVSQGPGCAPWTSAEGDPLLLHDVKTVTYSLPAFLIRSLLFVAPNSLVCCIDFNQSNGIPLISFSCQLLCKNPWTHLEPTFTAISSRSGIERGTSVLLASDHLLPGTDMMPFSPSGGPQSIIGGASVWIGSRQ